MNDKPLIISIILKKDLGKEHFLNVFNNLTKNWKSYIQKFSILSLKCFDLNIYFNVKIQL